MTTATAPATGWYRQHVTRRAAQRTAHGGPILTGRVTEVLALLGQGLTVPDVAARLWLSEHTVDSHTRHARIVLDAPTTQDAIDAARNRGLLGEVA